MKCLFLLQWTIIFWNKFVRKNLSSRPSIDLTVGLFSLHRHLRSPYCLLLYQLVIIPRSNANPLSRSYRSSALYTYPLCIRRHQSIDTSHHSDGRTRYSLDRSIRNGRTPSSNGSTLCSFARTLASLSENVRLETTKSHLEDHSLRRRLVSA